MGKLDRYQNEPGTWIPAAIMAVEELSLLDKHILSEIKFLGCNKNGCFASNAYLSDKLQVKINTVAHSVSKLMATGFIEKGKNPRGQRTLKCLFLTESDGVERCGIVSGGKVGPAKQHRSYLSEPDDESNDVLKYKNSQNRVLKYIQEQDCDVSKSSQRCIKIQPNYVFKYIDNPEMMYFYTRFQPVLKTDIKNSIKEKEKNATVVAPISKSIENLEDQNPKTQNEDQKTKPIEQPPSPTQPLLIDINANQNAINTNQPNNQFCIVADPADGKKPKAVRAKGGTNEITADVFFDMLTAVQRQAAIKVLLGEFIDSRRASKKPVTINAAKQIIRDFHRYNDIVLGVALQRSIKNGWRGLFLPDQANFVNDSAADIKSYRDLVDECRLNEDPEEKRARLLKAKEQEMRENEEEHKRFLQRQQTEKIAKEIEEAPISRTVTSTEHDNGDTAYYQYSQGKQETTATPEVAKPEPQPQPSTVAIIVPAGSTYVADLHQADWNEKLAYERKLEEERRINAIRRQERLVILNAKIAEMKAAEAALAAEKDSHVS